MKWVRMEGKSRISPSLSCAKHEKIETQKKELQEGTPTEDERGLIGANRVSGQPCS